MSERRSPLTPQQGRVLALALLDGLKSAEIAERLDIGKRTVDFHVNGAYRALGVTDRIEALHRLITLGLITLDTEARKLVGLDNELRTKPMPWPKRAGRPHAMAARPARHSSDPNHDTAARPRAAWRRAG